MMKNTILMILLFPCLHSFGQNLTIQQQDSICKFGKKYDRPKRTKIVFPAQNVSEEYKKKEFHKAIPESYKTDEELAPENRYHLLLANYYLSKDTLSYWDAAAENFIKLPKKRLFYILRDSYFFDVDGDSLLDFIHYPSVHDSKGFDDYKSSHYDYQEYNIFLQQKNGSYKWLSFYGFIIDINFNNDKTLKSIKTYHPRWGGGDESDFAYYTFDRKKRKLTETRRERILECQYKTSE
jgi:hypothetical protein